jgi:hypothetical protein
VIDALVTPHITKGNIVIHLLPDGGATFSCSDFAVCSLSLPYPTLFFFLLSVDSWQCAFGSNCVLFTTHSLDCIMSTKWEMYDFLKLGLDWPGDKEWREKSNHVDPLVVQEMVPARMGKAS